MTGTGVLSRLAPGELPELEAFFRALPMRVPAENLRQFSAPRTIGPGFEVVTLVLRVNGRIVGTVGWIDVPMIVRDARGLMAGGQTLRWPVNLYLLAECRGKGLGKRLMEATGDGATLRAVIGGNQFSRPVLDRTGWTVVGHLASVRWLRPCLDPSRLAERMGGAPRRPPPEVVALRRGGEAIVARRVERLAGWLPWAESRYGAGAEAGVVRDASYLDFIFGGALRRYGTLHAVTVSGALSGFFALAARGERRGILTAEILDLDAVPGRERSVIAAARATALSVADVARLRMCGRRFTEAMAALAGKRGLVQDHPLRISFDGARAIPGPHLSGTAAWRLSYGDHDQYRVRGASLAWRGAQEVGAVPTGAER